jgi:hypothetical protein
MQRDRDKSLQAGKAGTFPVLVDATEAASEGAFVGLGFSPRAVRSLTRRELANSSRVAHLLTPEQWRFVRGVATLKIALGKKDKTAINAALALLRNCIDSADPIWGVSLTTDQAEKYLSGSESIGFLRLLATDFLQKILAGARLVYWIRKSDMQIGPAVYCHDFKTAIAIHLILQDTFRVCPHCNTTFLAERPKQMCCSVECREAHRIARWRAAKRQENKP